MTVTDRLKSFITDYIEICNKHQITFDFDVTRDKPLPGSHQEYLSRIQNRQPNYYQTYIDLEKLNYQMTEEDIQPIEKWAPVTDYIFSKWDD